MPGITMANRVRDTSTTAGTGTINLLASTASGFRNFAASGIASGSLITYSMVDLVTGEWEVGRGTLTSGAPWTLSRTTVFASSNANAAVNFVSGNTRQVDLVFAAETMATLDQLQDMIGSFGFTAGGTADALTIGLSPALTAYAAGQRFWLVTGANSNTVTNPTLNVNGLGTRQIFGIDGTALRISELPTSSVISVLYDGGGFFRLMLPRAFWTGRRRATVSAVSTLDVTFDPGYSAFRLELWNLSMSTSAAGINVQCLTAGTPDTGATDYGNQITGGNGTTTLQSYTVGSSIAWTGTLLNGIANGVIRGLIVPGGASARFNTTTQFGGFESGANMRNFISAGVRAANGAKSGIRLIATSGTTSFDYTLEGVA